MKKAFYILFFLVCFLAAHFNLAAQCNPVADIDGNVYQAVLIGKQCWMKENMKTTHFRDGSAITEMEDKNAWSNTDQTNIPAWCYFENDTQNNKVYGKLYNWYVVSDPRNVCPAGWHVPDDEEFQTLANYLGGDSLAGGHMKALTLWQHPNKGGDNSSGFTALPGSYRISSGYFSLIKFYGLFWSVTNDGNDNAWLRNLGFNYSNALHFSDYKGDGASIRCIKN